MKPEEILKNHLNIDRLTPLQWDGIRRSMEEYAKQYTLSLLPSDEGMRKLVSKYYDKKNKTGYDPTILGVSDHYSDGLKDLKNEIINKLKS